MRVKTLWTKPAISIFKAQNENKPLLQKVGNYLPNDMNIPEEMTLEFRTDESTEYDKALSVRHFLSTVSVEEQIQQEIGIVSTHFRIHFHGKQLTGK